MAFKITELIKEKKRLKIIISQIDEEILLTLKNNKHKLKKHKFEKGKKQITYKYKRAWNILVMRYFNKMKYREIAERYNISTSLAIKIENKAIEIMDDCKAKNDNKKEEMSAEEWNNLLNKFNKINKNMDYRKNKKVIFTLEIEDKGQDFTEIDVLENGVILGNSIMFENGRISILGIGALTGMPYTTATQLLNIKRTPLFVSRKIENQYIYIKQTGEEDPMPWEAKTLNYKVIGIKMPVKPNRFIK